MIPSSFRIPDATKTKPAWSPQNLNSDVKLFEKNVLKSVSTVEKNTLPTQKSKL